jgi:hypothetical protein
MAARTPEEQAAALLGRSSLPASPEVDAVYVLQDIAMALAMHPSVVAYIALVARAGCLSAVQDERDAIAAVRQCVLDLGNPSFVVRDTRPLVRARTALLQIEGLDRPDAGASLLGRVSAAIDSFVSEQIAPAVARNGALARSADEARQDLPGLKAALLVAHEAFLGRLYALAVGVTNYRAAPLTSVIGLTTVARARRDLDLALSQTESGAASQVARDLAVRLVTSVEAVKAVSYVQPLTDTLIDSPNVPAGYDLKVMSSPVAPRAVGNPGPYALDSVRVDVAVGGESETAYLLPQEVLGKPFVVGQQVSYPVLVPERTHLFVALDGMTVRIPLNETDAPASMTLGQITAAIEATGSVGALEVLPGRILLYAKEAAAISVEGSLTEVSFKTLTWQGAGGVTESKVVEIPVAYTRSAHVQLGLSAGTAGSGEIEGDLVVDLLSARLSLAAASLEDGRLVLTARSVRAGTALSVQAPVSLGVTCSGVTAVSDEVLFFGKTPEREVADPYTSPPISPLGLISVGDELETPAGRVPVVHLTEGGARLAHAVPTFSGAARAYSAVVTTYWAMDAVLQRAVDRWIGGPFHTNLARLDLTLSSLLGSPGAGPRNDAVRVLDELDTRVAEVGAALADPSTFLPDGSGETERAILEKILRALRERHFDLAEEFVLKCRLYELFSLTYETASRSGSILKAISDLARSDLRVEPPEDSVDTIRAIRE